MSKFISGIVLAGLGFIVLGISTLYPDARDLINPLWVFSAYILITMGELLLSPIGLSAVTVLAPPRSTGVMMGVWFVATGFGGLFAGVIAKMASIPETAQTVAEKLSIYRHAFFNFAYIAFGAALILFLVYLVVRIKVLNKDPLELA